MRREDIGKLKQMGKNDDRKLKKGKQDEINETWMGKRKKQKE